MHTLGVRAPAQLFEVAIETLELGEKSGVERITVEHANGVVWIHRGHEAVASVLDRLEVTRRYKTGHAGDGEITRLESCHDVAWLREAVTAAAGRRRTQ